MRRALAVSLLTFFVASNGLTVALVTTEEEPKPTHDLQTRKETIINEKSINEPILKGAGNEQEKEEEPSKGPREEDQETEEAAEPKPEPIKEKAEPKKVEETEPEPEEIEKAPEPAPKPQPKQEPEPEPEVKKEPKPEPEPTTQAPDVLYKLVEAEAQGEGYAGKRAVAIVVLNRVEVDSFPNSIRSVVMQDGQFSPVSNGRLWSVEVTEETRNAVNDAMNTSDTLSGALFFMNPDTASTNWIAENKTVVTRIGGHVFYK
jgi:N-acetylmuramoyl-L-alanine amidase